MRTRALGTAPDWTPAAREEPLPAAPSSPPVEHAVVAARDDDGVPSRFILPGPLVGDAVSIIVELGRGGEAAWAGRVQADGTVQLGADAGDVLATVPRGTPFVAATDSSGRVLALAARAPAAAVSKLLRRPVPRTRGRSSDPLEHNPHELLYSGAAGRVLRVT